MTTIAIAERLVSLCKAGNFMQAQQELYDEDIICIDPDGSRTIGMDNILIKEQRFIDRLEKIISIDYSGMLIAGSYFTVVLTMEMELKKVGYKKFSEVCVYSTKNGKITFEQFFRDWVNARPNMA